MTPSSPCAEPHCPRYARPGSSRCDPHTRERERERSAERRRRAPGFNYDGQKWRRTSRRYRFEHPLCEWPGEEGHALAEDVHHIVSPFEGGAPYDFANLQALCKRHHGAVGGKHPAGG